MVVQENFKISMDLGVYTEYQIRTMEESDYEEVYELWTTIHGFAMRSLDDSKEGILKFIKRNPNTSVVAVVDGKIVGSILAGHDGRHGSFYHVCVHEDYRKHGIGKAMVTSAMVRLKNEGINKVQLVAFSGNEIGNHFWHAEGWREREDYNTYDFVLNDENIIKFNS
ncbi:MULTISPECIES: GNAT family N-acetyltransferase [Pseudobutyrivibrio]|uniref:Ribosomal protein S18 acetylase RimI n=2 Tax=Pseudobutyrivibrio ruminis TaxID=46206 RepID=A0A1H7I926_9FIRM|nr:MULTISPECIES: GNAT family N-acetyltransferase [Pseudobutyrivibrio]SEK58257.1 Ribosomal protein S18 acetylase RimI [Pseudobutyrivibrio ruminis]SES75480.1 Ribosomal protein S18 acetylase RimI [Pseudobutyrivibrio sp. C4]SFO29500.1 Ribosomal protein S18 acetylase RimI [Pseudobutyrivibrio sp. JW11]SOC13176.1 Ribosomal protein S18 acetylase RimI [Pseudobutyrivibrio ruminis DSM 9787]